MKEKPETTSPGVAWDSFQKTERRDKKLGEGDSWRHANACKVETSHDLLTLKSDRSGLIGRQRVKTQHGRNSLESKMREDRIREPVGNHIYTV